MTNAVDTLESALECKLSKVSLIDEMKGSFEIIDDGDTLNDNAEACIPAELYFRAIKELEQAERMREFIKEYIKNVEETCSLLEWENEKYVAKAKQALSSLEAHQ